MDVRNVLLIDEKRYKAEYRAWRIREEMVAGWEREVDEELERCPSVTEVQNQTQPAVETMPDRMEREARERKQARRAVEDEEAPTLSLSMPNQTSMVASWTKCGTYGYDLQWRVKGTASWSCFSSTLTVCNVCDLDKGTTYQFRVRAMRGPWSDTVEGTTSAVPGGE